MNVLRISGGQGAGKSQTLASIQAAGWRIGGKVVDNMSLTLCQGRLNDLGNIIDRTGQKPQVLYLDVEATLTPVAQQKLIQIAESRGVQQLFLAYTG